MDFDVRALSGSQAELFRGLLLPPEVHVVRNLDQVIEGVHEGAGAKLAVKIDREQARPGVDGLVAGHACLPRRAFRRAPGGLPDSFRGGMIVEGFSTPSLGLSPPIVWSRRMPALSFEVRGMRPVPWGSNEWAWRGAIASQARNTKVDAVTPSATFTVQLVFRMVARNIDRADLDNLAKPVLDTMFLPRNVQVRDRSLAGTVFHCDDDRVFRLELEKRLVETESDEGIDVRVTW